MKTTSKILLVIGFVFIIIGFGLFLSPVTVRHTEVYIFHGGSAGMGMGIGFWKENEIFTVNFTLPRGNTTIALQIKGPSGIVYDEIVTESLNHSFTVETEGYYGLDLQATSDSDSEKTMTFPRQNIVTHGIDTTLMGAGVILVVMIGLGGYRMIFPEIIEEPKEHT